MSAIKNSSSAWDKRLNPNRRKPSTGNVPFKSFNDTRTEIERDFDRILFSTPVRRLADKTQVFPLERNASIRTRLTHSHEVSNLARSVGVAIAFSDQFNIDVPDAKRNIPALLAAAGLAHDLGNPPFGHQGEAAISKWFNDRQQLLDPITETGGKQDFLKFEGNAQTFRLVTRLQYLTDEYGLNLTYATLAGLMKYTTSSNKTDKKNACTKKHGFFYSEKEIAELVLTETGLQFNKRHPLAYIMEACDDIAYSVLDVEDAIKKGLASYTDLTTFLRSNTPNGDSLTTETCKRCDEKINNTDIHGKNLSPAEINDISMQLFRVAAIGELISAVTSEFSSNTELYLQGTAQKPILDTSAAKSFIDGLKKFARRHAYTHNSVLEVELNGYNTLQELMSMLWAAIVDREDPRKLNSPRKNPFTRYAYGLISENYRRIFESPENNLSIRYKECQLLTDMISGMTDSFAIQITEELKQYRGNFDVDIFSEKSSSKNHTVFKLPRRRQKNHPRSN